MKILFICHLGQIQEYAGYVTALKKVGAVESVFLAMGADECDLAKELGAFDVVKDILPTDSDLDAGEADGSVAAGALHELENRLGYKFVNRDILMDRFFQGRPRLDIGLKKMPLIWTGGRTRQFMHLIATSLESEMAKFCPDFMFVETSFGPTRLAWRLAREKGISAGGFMSVRFWPERMYLETGIGYDWHEVRTAYKDMSQEPMAGEELAEVKKRLQTIIEQKTKPAYLQSDHAKGAPRFRDRIHPKKLLAGLNPWLGRRARTCTRNPHVLPGQMFSPLEKYARFRKGQAAKRYLRSHQTPFSEFRDQKYVVCFLHVEPEITVEGMAFDYRNQVEMLRDVLAALPADVNLVVKEHTPMLGFRQLDDYKRLVHTQGIIVADTHEDSHSLITHASAVVTLTGTVALEAILYGVPAIVLGSIYFDGFNGIYKPQSLGELKLLLSAPERLSGATEEDALRTLGSMRRASVPGRPHRVDVALQDIDPESAETMMSELRKVSAGA